MTNNTMKKVNQPPTGQGKKQSPRSGRNNELNKRSEVLQAQRGHPELNMGTSEDVEPAHRGDGNNPDVEKAGR